jgi:hypothetical protein
LDGDDACAQVGDGDVAASLGVLFAAGAKALGIDAQLRRCLLERINGPGCIEVPGRRR